MTATWARLAASATRVKSLRKRSVDGCFVCAGGGGAMVIGVAADLGPDIAEEEEEEEDVVLGDEMGAFIVFVRMVRIVGWSCVRFGASLFSVVC